MATIECLQLRGIRSYGPSSDTQIIFSSPLTILAGHTGSGKTAILEALKLAATGELPHSGKKSADGADFVHDPVIRSQSKTDATVCLTFTDVNGVKRRVDRCFALTASPSSGGWQRKFECTKRTIQQMGSHARIETCIATEINTTMSRLLRVSKPVLDNVVLVRQEESLWPLGKPGALKRVMDDIVAATSYANVLKEIRSCKKDQDKGRENVEAEMHKYAAKVQDLERLEKEIDDVKKDHQDVTSDVQVLDDELVGLRSERERASEIADAHERKCSERNQLRDDKKRTEWSKDEKLKSMPRSASNMSERTLEANIKQLEASLARTGREGSRPESEIENLQADIEQNKTSEQAAFLNDKRRLEHEIGLHVEQLKRLETLKEQFLVADYFGNTNNPINHRALPLRTSSNTDWTQSLKLFLKDAKETVLALSEDGKKKKTEAFGCKNAALVSVISKTQEKNRVEAELSNLRRELSSIADPQQSLEEAKKKFEDLKQSWEERSERVAHLKRELEEQRDRVRRTKEKLSVLETRQKEVARNQQKEARYYQCCQAEDNAKSLTDRVLSEFTDLICTSIPDDNLELLPLKQSLQQLSSDYVFTLATAQARKRILLDAHKKVVRQEEKVIQEAERIHKNMDAARNTASGRKTQVKADFRGVEIELEEAKRKVRDEIPYLMDIPRNVVDKERMVSLFPDIQRASNGALLRPRQDQLDFIEETITKVDMEVQKANTTIIRLEPAGVLHAEKDLEDFNNSKNDDGVHQCPACGLTSNSNVEDMRRNLENRVLFYKNPRNREVANRELKKLTDARDILRKVHKVVREALSMIPRYGKATENLEKANRSLQICQTNAEQAQRSFEATKTRLGNGAKSDNVESKRVECRKAFVDWETARQDIGAQAELSENTRDFRSSSELLDEMSNLRGKLSRQEEIVDSTRQEQEDSSQIERHFLAAQMRFMKVKSEKMHLSKLSMSANACQAQKETLTSTIAKLQEVLDSSTEEYYNIRDATDSVLEKAKNEFAERGSALDKWKTCLSDVQHCNRLQKDRELAKVKTSLQDIRERIGSQTKMLNSLQSQQRSRLALRNLRNEQEFRRLGRQLFDIDRRIQDKEKEISDLEQEANGTPTSKVADINTKIKEKDLEKASKTFQQEAHLQKLTELEKELDEMERQDFRRKLSEFRIRKQTEQLASNDLERYYRATDQALTAFHTLKMKSINKTIKELWHQTYHGTDIDDIEITADDLATDPSAALKRDFTYRVQMRQGKSKVDMRGRCSTGQKVLACLVIRLALAESFCTDCGIFALDQPTANLDREHAESLAVALRKIIENRSKRGKFQLLLITQDHEFIDMLGAQDYCDDFYVISKDGRGISKAQLKGWQEL